MQSLRHISRIMILSALATITMAYASSQSLLILPPPKAFKLHSKQKPQNKRSLFNQIEHEGERALAKSPTLAQIISYQNAAERELAETQAPSKVYPHLPIQNPSHRVWDLAAIQTGLEAINYIARMERRQAHTTSETAHKPAPTPAPQKPPKPKPIKTNGISGGNGSHAPKEFIAIPKQPSYHHKLISLNFQDIPTRSLLQIIAQFVNINFVVSDAVKGSMSIHLKKVPWDEALNVILKSQGLGQRAIGNIVFVAPLAELARYEIEDLRAKQEVQKLVPLHNLVIKLHYAPAVDIAKILQSGGATMLSHRGHVAIDKRTNSIWVRDIPSRLTSIHNIVTRLDIPVRQVLIEARIVEIRQNFDQEIGSRFGLTAGHNLSGTLEGANDLANGTPPGDIKIADRLNFDMPAMPLFGRAGTIGLALAKMGDTYLDLELSALEQEGKVHLVSAPRLITSDLHPAYIQTGEEIPYQEATSSGATAIQFKDAVLSLKVTPHITPDHRIILHLTVSNNRAGKPVKLEEGGEAIPIVTQEEQSRVLLNDHQTVVLGGVYTQDRRKVVTRIPFFGTIPLVGLLFRHSTKVDAQGELLIFLTPHIIHSPDQLL